MKNTISKLEKLLSEAKLYITNSPREELENKPKPEKWSKKEILGHLIDSGINNLQRFTEIQYSPKPYPIRKYDQDALVVANDYQNADINDLLDFWVAINKQIIRVIEKQNEQMLDYAVVIVREQNSDLRFLIFDYVEHMEHHLRQIGI